MLDGPFRGSVAIARGQVTPGELRGRRYVRLYPDVYVPADTDPSLRVRSSAAFLLVDGAVLAGYSAAEVLGAGCGPAGAPAEVLVSGHVRARPGLLVRRGTAVGADRWTVGGLPVTSPLRTAWDLGRRLDLVEAVVAIDALAARGGFAPSMLLDRREAEPGARGCRRLDRAAALSDPRAESPMETRLRLALVLAGLPSPEVQYRLVLGREGSVRFDLAYPRVKLAIEYDGASHDGELDRRRDIRAGRLGWYTARFTRHEIGRPAMIAAAVAELMARRERLFDAERDVTADRA